MNNEIYKFDDFVEKKYEPNSTDVFEGVETIENNNNPFEKESIESAIYDYWYGTTEKNQLEQILNSFDPEDLVDFILTAQDKGRFGNGYIHD